MIEGRHCTFTSLKKYQILNLVPHRGLSFVINYLEISSGDIIQLIRLRGEWSESSSRLATINEAGGRIHSAAFAFYLTTGATYLLALFYLSYHLYRSIDSLSTTIRHTSRPRSYSHNLIHVWLKFCTHRVSE